MIAGMDFGTTNSGMSVYDGRSINVLPLDPANRNPRVARTALYVTNEQQISIGREAVNKYFEQNIGRSVKAKKVWVGEIEIRGADMYYVTDAYVYVDVLSPGRLFLSIKTGLRDKEYTGSVVGQHFYALENIIALYLHVTKVRAEQQLGRELRQVVLGRPVHFAFEPENDRLAQSRLLQAAFRAGYETVYLQPEPIAAAHSYETSITTPENALVFDFGGGTLDLTVIRLGDPGQRKVLATGGIPIAGDVFDQKLVRAKLPRHFGEGSYYGPRHKALKVPQWIYDAFSNWQTLLELQTAENKKVIREIAQTAQRRYQIEALESLVSSNYGLQMFDIVEQAKRRLSEKRGAAITLEGPGFSVHEFVTRSEFESIIRNEIRAIDTHIDETVQASGLTPEQIDAVIRTGGSSQIPAFDEMLQRKFGPDKVRRIDTFSSVTAGLGIIGHRIAAGEIDARAYTPADVADLPDAKGSKPMIKPVNLELLQRRIQVQEGLVAGVTAQTERALVVLGDEQTITAVPLPDAYFQNEAITLASLDLAGPVRAAIIAGWDEQILIVTSHYRFLLMTPRELVELQSVNIQLAQVHQLGRRESLCSLSRWPDLKASAKMLIVTSLGLARPYPMRVMVENIEAPVPLKFDHQLFGIPVATLPAADNQTLALVTGGGRAVRYPVRALLGSGTQALNCGQDDRVSGAALGAATDELLLLTADGYGRRLRADQIKQPEKENSKGRSQVARRSPIAVVANVSTDSPLWLVTSARIAPLAAEGIGRLPLEDSTKTYPLLKLAAGETVQTGLHDYSA